MYVIFQVQKKYGISDYFECVSTEMQIMKQLTVLLQYASYINYLNWSICK